MLSQLDLRPGSPDPAWTRPRSGRLCPGSAPLGSAMPQCRRFWRRLGLLFAELQPELASVGWVDDHLNRAVGADTEAALDPLSAQCISVPSAALGKSAE